MNFGEKLKQLRSEKIISRSENRYLILLGALLTFSGIFGFFVEFRLRKI